MYNIADLDESADPETLRKIIDQRVFTEHTPATATYGFVLIVTGTKEQQDQVGCFLAALYKAKNLDRKVP